MGAGGGGGAPEHAVAKVGSPLLTDHGWIHDIMEGLSAAFAHIEAIDRRAAAPALGRCISMRRAAAAGLALAAS
eukprot:SAG31_NODE_8995_length_1350_cov_2.358913_3_plen_73_part_01